MSPANLPQKKRNRKPIKIKKYPFPYKKTCVTKCGHLPKKGFLSMGYFAKRFIERTQICQKKMVWLNFGFHLGFLERHFSLRFLVEDIANGRTDTSPVGKIHW